MRKIRTGAATLSLLLTFAFAIGAQATTGRLELRPFVTITSPANGATVTSSPVTVTGTAGGGAGVKSVTVNGVIAAVSAGNRRLYLIGAGQTATPRPLPPSG